MAKTLLQCWLDHYDPIHRGWTPAGIANGVCTTNGFFFPRICGGYNLRRSTGAIPDSSSDVVGATGSDAETIQTFPWVTHDASTTYTYRLTAVNGGGAENWTDELVADVDFNIVGSWFGTRPNSPSDLRVTPVANGRFLLRWVYSPEGEMVAPQQFNIYTDEGSGVVDYSINYDFVDYRPGQIHYEIQTNYFAHGTRVKWAVRAESSVQAVEDDNENVVIAESQVNGPPINPTVVIDCG